MNQYFYEDQVFTIDKKGSVKFGLVVENEVPSDGEYENHTETEKFLRKGELRVVWYPEGKDEIILERNVGLADRTLMPGDVVRRMTESDTQRGYCREIRVKADLKILGNSRYIIKDVLSERLVPLVSIPRDNAVCLNGWVGSTKNIDEKLTLRSTCGSVLELRPDIDYFPFKDKNNRSVFSSNLFYVGQQLIGPVYELDNAKWIIQTPDMRTSRKHKAERKFTVQSVEVDGVYVHWQCKASCEENSSSGESGIPKSYITGEDLKKMKRLNLFESCMLQINDKNYLNVAESDVIVRKSQWKKEQSNKYRILSSRTNQNLENSEASNNTYEQYDTEKFKLTECEKQSVNVQNKLNECDRTKLCPQSKKFLESDEWQTEEEEDEEVLSDSGTTASSCSSNPTPKGSPKKSPLLSHKIRKLKKHKQRDPKERQIPQIGDRVVTEVLVVYSWATVVWQDGSIEKDIPSTELCPIHHLDDHEFFPADFVLAANDSANFNPSYRDYGVIQKVDHLGRIAKVKWFSTYTNIDEPTPIYKGESEVSVYDLKDHPDFQYRPGTIVIRVANFPSDQQCATAGQVVDNYPEGRVKVWWVDGTVSMCWPQDLFEVGQYDSENNFWGNGGDSDDESWQTEDEFSEPGGMPQQQHLTANLERARKAMARLEELFIINPNLQSQEVMKKLLMVYKKCRYLDRLMNTSFFHESNFMGLVERVRKGGSQTTAERVLEKKNRLFNETPLSGNIAQSSVENTSNTGKTLTKKISLLEATKSSSSNSNSHEDNSSYCSFESTKSCFQPSTRQASQESPTKKQNLLVVASEAWKQQGKFHSTSSDISSITDDNLKLSSCSSPSSAYKTPSPKKGEEIEKNSTDSGILITLDNGSLESSKQIIEAPESNSSSFVITVCAKLCSLIKIQLVKALQEINNRYCPSDTFKEIVELEMDSKVIAKIDSEFEEEEISSPDEVKSFNLTDCAAMTKKEEYKNKTKIEGEKSCIDNFQVIDHVPSTHKYHLTVFHPTNPHSFYKAVQKEHKLLKNSLPSGVWTITFEDRLDLLSVLIQGPTKTPYEDGLFAFDIQLGHDYPKSPPLCHYISYCRDRLNPNLYEDGKVCVSLLGTWSGRGTEIWCPNSSTLLQVIVSLQGLILVDEPYYNEAGYEKQRGTQQGKENSRMYNEMVVLKLVQSMTKLISSPPEVFGDIIQEHFRRNGENFYYRIKSWMELSGNNSNDACKSSTSEGKCSAISKPEFPLIPASKGFCLTLVTVLDGFYQKLHEIKAVS
ncbi:unnamed protein product [Chironomus riparius]|uniref:UBC core domain-containing protein n=1 Tax=Chironomus riparius TaxID=315576 RepID=A0A9N9WW27_9DIPT|nr:unnamed protein product [Chironomus riparius]